jgi:hypothetical protein
MCGAAAGKRGGAVRGQRGSPNRTFSGARRFRGNAISRFRMRYVTFKLVGASVRVQHFSFK